MLREHLSQAHDRASRRFETIDRQVAWLDAEVLGGRPSRVLDLGCGPGFYCSRLSRKGHRCLGVDFSPASIEYARAEAGREALACEYRLADLRAGAFGGPFDLVMMISGELNTFEPSEAPAILAAAAEVMAPGAAAVLEVHTEAAVTRIGERPGGWSAHATGLFSDRAHLLLRESAWLPDEGVSTERYFVVDTSTASVVAHSITTKAYAEADYHSLLSDAGFRAIERQDSLEGQGVAGQEDFVVYVARR